ncbi:Hypothetical protein R9X50_00740500 [Acrodontium crateriforme]|uniref:Uncharacterized protein n=1 Tax=Acrodontium crateriforme TaxID=150365 RepID=A0AAQ3RE53_9PEZI|nr:Hypothetical protein R9X50_00740500 [Acrodontium crateriforme]
MSSTGHSIYRAALVLEMIGNLGSVPSWILDQETALRFLVRGPSGITPVSKSFAQWFGGIVFALTIPLIMAFPSSGDRQVVIARRQLTYWTLGAGEFALGGLMAMQYLDGDSGLSEDLLVKGMMTMAGLMVMRLFFLFVKPEWMDPAATQVKEE